MVRNSPSGEVVGRPRLVPHRPLPPYSYVPGHAPHPVSHPDGHMFGTRELGAVTPLDPARWDECEEYLYGIDLFNHGYYWEAHETWEGLWHSAGRTGPVAAFLKALIKLAAAAVKAREGSPTGATRHAARAKELLEAIEAGAFTPQAFAGLEMDVLRSAAEVIASSATQEPVPTRVFDAILHPR